MKRRSPSVEIHCDPDQIMIADIPPLDIGFWDRMRNQLEMF
mgnify:CR=1 FL=1